MANFGTDLSSEDNWTMQQEPHGDDDDNMILMMILVMMAMLIKLTKMVTMNEDQ